MIKAPVEEVKAEQPAQDDQIEKILSTNLQFKSIIKYGFDQPKKDVVKIYLTAEELAGIGKHDKDRI